MKQLLSFAVSLFVSASFAYGGSLQGVVRDAQSLIPLDSVKVTVHVLPDSVAFPTTTDENGTYSITGIIPNNDLYAVVTHRTGYIWSYTRIDNLGSLDLVYDIYITPDTATIPPITPPPPGGDDTSVVFGTIMSPSAQDGSLIPVVNAQVKLTSGDQHLDALTNAEGKYAVGIQFGLCYINIIADGYNSLTSDRIFVQSTTAMFNAVLKSKGTGVNTEPGQSRPGRYAVLNAYPNPFNPSATIQFSLPERGWATLKVYDHLGREVAVLAAGEFAGGVEHRVTFNASNFASGVYFSRLDFNNQSIVKKLMLLK